MSRRHAITLPSIFAISAEEMAGRSSAASRTTQEEKDFAPRRQGAKADKKSFESRISDFRISELRLALASWRLGESSFSIPLRSYRDIGYSPSSRFTSHASPDT